MKKWGIGLIVLSIGLANVPAGAAPGDLLLTFQKPVPATDDYSGRSIAAIGNNALVGVPHDDTGANNAGGVFLFDGTTGSLLRTFQNPTPESGDHFGFSVAAMGNTVLARILHERSRLWGDLVWALGF